jgi:hypothetical protein
MAYLQEDAPKKVIETSPQMGYLNLGKDLNLSKNL